MSERPVAPIEHLGELLAAARARTPARVLHGSTSAAYQTATQLELRAAHAAARDAVWESLDLHALGTEFVEKYGLFLVETEAATKAEFLQRPDRGRRFTAESAAEISAACPRGADVQIVLGDGLSAPAVVTQAPILLPRLDEAFRARGWSVGQTFVVRHARVGLLNEIGRLLESEVVVLLIGERPGLATAESLSAYFAYRPRLGHTDAQRNLVSNIHARGIPAEEAAPRIVALAAKLREARISGIDIKEDLPRLT